MYSNSTVRFDTISGHNQKLMSSSQIELSLSARKLVNRDITSKSDPQCFAYIKQGFNDKFVEIGRTEMIKGFIHLTFDDNYWTLTSIIDLMNIFINILKIIFIFFIENFA